MCIRDRLYSDRPRPSSPVYNHLDNAVTSVLMDDLAKDTSAKKLVINLFHVPSTIRVLFKCITVLQYLVYYYSKLRTLSNVSAKYA